MINIKPFFRNLGIGAVSLSLLLGTYANYAKNAEAIVADIDFLPYGWEAYEHKHGSFKVIVDGIEYGVNLVTTGDTYDNFRRFLFITDANGRAINKETEERIELTALVAYLHKKSFDALGKSIWSDELKEQGDKLKEWSFPTTAFSIGKYLVEKLIDLETRVLGAEVTAGTSLPQAVTTAVNDTVDEYAAGFIDAIMKADFSGASSAKDYVKKFEEIVKKRAEYQIYQAGYELDSAASILEKYDEDGIWTYEDAINFFTLWRDGNVRAIGNFTYITELTKEKSLVYIGEAMAKGIGLEFILKNDARLNRARNAMNDKIAEYEAKFMQVRMMYSPWLHGSEIEGVDFFTYALVSGFIDTVYRTWYKDPYDETLLRYLEGVNALAYSRLLQEIKTGKKEKTPDEERRGSSQWYKDGKFKIVIFEEKDGFYVVGLENLDDPKDYILYMILSKLPLRLLHDDVSDTIEQIEEKTLETWLEELLVDYGNILSDFN